MQQQKINKAIKDDRFFNIESRFNIGRRYYKKLHVNSRAKAVSEGQKLKIVPKF